MKNTFKALYLDKCRDKTLILFEKSTIIWTSKQAYYF